MEITFLLMNSSVEKLPFLLNELDKKMGRGIQPGPPEDCYETIFKDCLSVSTEYGVEIIPRHPRERYI